MNKDNAHLYLPLVQALADGKTLQLKMPRADSWTDISEAGLTFNLPAKCYRIKPEPFELFAIIESTEEGDRLVKDSLSFAVGDKQHWVDAIKEDGRDVRIVKLREVRDED